MPQVTEDKLLAAIETRLVDGADPALRVVPGAAALETLESGDVLAVPTLLEFAPGAQSRRHWELGVTVLVAARLGHRGTGTSAFAEILRLGRAAYERVQGEAALTAYRAVGGHNVKRTRLRYTARPGREGGLIAAALFGLTISFTE